MDHIKPVALWIVITFWEFILQATYGASPPEQCWALASHRNSRRRIRSARVRPCTSYSIGNPLIRVQCFVLQSVQAAVHQVHYAVAVEPG